MGPENGFCFGVFPDYREIGGKVYPFKLNDVKMGFLKRFLQCMSIVRRDESDCVVRFIENKRLSRAFTGDTAAGTSTNRKLAICRTCSGMASGWVWYFKVFMERTVTRCPNPANPLVRFHMAMDPPSLAGQGGLLVSCRILIFEKPVHYLRR